MNPPHEHAPHAFARCPLCGERVDRRVLAKYEHVEAPVAARLHAEHPEWRREHGACFRCVAWALADLLEAERAEDSPEKNQYSGVVPPEIGRRAEVLSLQARLRPDLNYLGRGVTVAIVDSDFVLHPDFTHPKGRMVTYVDARTQAPVADAEPPEPYLGSWHGTMVAGAAFGSGASAGGRYPGLAPLAKLVLVRIADEKLQIGEPQVLRGLRWVVKNREKYNIRVVNLSVGGDVPARSNVNKLDRLAARAVKQGIVVVAAAGNRPDRKPVAPASSPDVITVGGVNDLGGAGMEHLQMFAGSHGPTLDGVEKPDVLAPAIWVPAPMVPDTPQADEAELLIEIEELPDALLAKTITKRFAELSLPADIILRPPEEIRRQISERRRGQKFITAFHQHVDGTSFACAIVSAVAAQMLEANPGLTPAIVKDILRQTARPIPGVPREIQGAGVVRPALAVHAALEHRLGRIPHIDSPAIDGESVHYHYYDPTERLTGVDWVGAIGGWKPQPMRLVARALWACERPLPTPGRYPYKFVLGDGHWTSDPANEVREPDGFGDWNSVLVVRRG